MGKQHCRFAKNKVWIRTKWNVRLLKSQVSFLEATEHNGASEKTPLLQVVPVLEKKVKQTLKNKPNQGVSFVDTCTSVQCQFSLNTFSRKPSATE